MLIAAELAGLFLVPLDDQREWFRYHQLFADVLRARLSAASPDRVATLHSRASAWYAARATPASTLRATPSASAGATPSDIDADTDDAVAHALAGGDAARAAYLLEAALPRARTERREATLTRWLDRLPPGVVADSPVLTMLGAHRLLTRGELAAAEDRLTHAERTLAAPRAPGAQPWADTVELRTLPASIEVYRAAVALARGDLPGTTAHAQHALELAAPTDHLSRGSAQGFLAMAAWAEGELSAAIEAATHAAASLGSNGNRVDELSLTVVLAELHTAQGHPSRARQLCERALATAQAEGAPVAKATAELHLALGELDHADGRLDSARAHLDCAAALVERLPVSEGRHRWFEAMSRVRLCEGDPDEAHALLTEAERLFAPGFFPDLRPIAAQRARLWIRAGQLGHAQAWARSAEMSASDELPSLGELAYLGEYAALTSVRLLLAQGRATADPTPVRQALAHLDRLHAAAAAGARASSLLEIEVLQALALDALGDRQSAFACLGAALQGWPDPTIPVGRLLDEGRWLLDLLRAAPAGGALGERARRSGGQSMHCDAEQRGARHRVATCGAHPAPTAFSPDGRRRS
jgi:LuxR family maltose regulon positive regulatory protein